MKRYFVNVLTALQGRDPYRMELDELKEKLEKAGENVRGLNEMYYSACEKWEAAEKQAKSLQALTENLRERIREKDALIEQLIESYKTTSKT